MTTQPRDLGRLVREHIETLVRRYTDALDACGYDSVIVLSGSPQLLTRDDQAYPFRADPYFSQWLPLDAPESAIELVPGRKPRLLYVRHTDFWHEPASELGEPWIGHFDIDVLDDESIAVHLGRRSKTTAVIGCASACRARPGTDADANANALIAHLDYDRAIKTAYESACIADANEVAARGHNAVAAGFADDLSEFDLHLEYTRATRQSERELPYATIIGINEHAAVLHYQNRRRSRPLELRSLLIDAGATVRGYGADVTRTHVRHAGLFAELVESLEQLQQTLCREARDGVDFVALNERAHELLAQVLVSHRLVTCSAEAAYEMGVTTTFLPHGLGHLLGIQVHDVGGHAADRSGARRAPPPRHPYLRLTRDLEPGFVVTIEPGLYFIPSLLEALRGRQRTALDWLRIEALIPFGGIRIEDNVLVESTGARNLTREAFAVIDQAKTE